MISTPEFAAVANPAETIPAPDTDKLPRVASAEDESEVVFPSATTLFAVPLATVVAPEITRAPAPAAVVEKPTETPPAPEIETLVSDCDVELVAAVVFPIANWFCVPAMAAAVAPEIITLPAENPTDTPP